MTPSQQPELPEQEAIWDSAVAATFQPHSLRATLQPLYLALRPLCSYCSCTFPQKQFQGLLSCAEVVTISSVDTSCYRFHPLVYFLSFVFLLQCYKYCHPCFLNSTENFYYLHYRNYSCLDTVAYFLLYLHFITFFNIFMHLWRCYFPLMFVLFLLIPPYFYLYYWLFQFVHVICLHLIGILDSLCIW